MAEPTAPVESPLFDTNKTHVVAPNSPQLSDGFVLNEVPTSALLNFLYNTGGAWINYLQAKLSLFPGYAADTTLTIAAGSITPVSGNHAIETTGGGASSNLTNISTANLGDGRLLVLTCLNPAHVVVLKQTAGGAGQIHLNDGLDFSLNSVSSFITLKRVGADWYELSRSILPAAELPGFIKAYGGSNAPVGYLLCDGAAVSRTFYASLYSVVGNSFGIGDGVNTFNVPMLKGRFLRGIADQISATCTNLPGSNNATFTAHPYKQSGTRVQLTSGTMTGLSAGVPYYLIYIDANTLAFASSLVNALGGAKLPISVNAAATINQWEDPDVLARVMSTGGAAAAAAIGSLQLDMYASHVHSATYMPVTAFNSNIAGGGHTVQENPGSSTTNTSSAGGNETRPLNVGVNYLIKF